MQAVLLSALVAFICVLVSFIFIFFNSSFRVVTMQVKYVQCQSTTCTGD